MCLQFEADYSETFAMNSCNIFMIFLLVIMN